MNSKNKTNPLKNRGLSFEVVLYPKDTEKWKQFTTYITELVIIMVLFCIPKILKNESNSQREDNIMRFLSCCFVSQRYWKMKAIHNYLLVIISVLFVVLYPKDTEKWKQFTTLLPKKVKKYMLFCIPKILKNESNSQRICKFLLLRQSCFVSQRYWKMKAIHNIFFFYIPINCVVLYPKDTEKWKQFTTHRYYPFHQLALFCIPKILKNESNSQRNLSIIFLNWSCFVSQRYWKMKAIHNCNTISLNNWNVVLYPKDTEKWKQFTTYMALRYQPPKLFCIPKILKNESNSQQCVYFILIPSRCFVSQRYWKMKAIHNLLKIYL